MRALPDADRALLTKMFGRLGSDQPGEILAAVHLINQFLQRRQVTWDNVINPPSPKPEGCRAPPKPEPNSEPQSDCRDNMFFCQQNYDYCSEWEQDFIHSVSKLRRLSQKQQDCLGRIADKLRARGFV